MTITDLFKMRDRVPFRPFKIHLVSGAPLPVEHPEQMHLNPDADLFTLWVGPEWNLIDVSAIERITTSKHKERTK